MEYKIIALPMVALALIGCDHNPPKEVLVPVPIVVKIDKPDRPMLMSDLMEKEEDRVRAAKTDIMTMKKYTEDLERLIEEHDKVEPVMPAGFKLIKEE